MKKEILHNFKFILVDPQSPENVGLICRVLKNFNFRELWIKGEVDKNKILKTATGSKDIVENITTVSSLKQALLDVNLVVGTSRRLRKDVFSFNLLHIYRYLLIQARKGKVAVVFGREDRGLTKEEVNLCDFLVKIPTSSFESLNISHAVSIFCYQLFIANFFYTGLPKFSLCRKEDLEYIFSLWEKILFKTDIDKNLMFSLKRIFRRSLLSSKEATNFKLLLKKILERL